LSLILVYLHKHYSYCRSLLSFPTRLSSDLFREAEFDMMYGEGISREGDLLDQGVERKIIEKSGTWFSYNGERLGQGRENAKSYLRQNPNVAADIELRLRRELGLPTPSEE